MTENEISAEILDAAIAVHNSIGGHGVLIDAARAGVI